MSGTPVVHASLSVARLLALEVEIRWEEAIAAVCAADALSDSGGIPITLEHCEITAAGEVRLSYPPAGACATRISSFQLLVAMLRCGAATRELRALATAVDDRWPCDDGDGRLRVDLQWCLGADPQGHLARLADRGLARALESGRHAGGRADAPEPMSHRANATPAFAGIAPPLAHPSLTVRVAPLTWGVALTMAATLCLGLSGAVVTALVLTPRDARPSASIVLGGGQAGSHRPATSDSHRLGFEAQPLPEALAVGGERPVHVPATYSASR